jgi:hypothetical protein
VLAIASLATVASSCVTYSGVSKSPEGDLYISGATNYFIFSSPWIRRCKIDDTTLHCVELSEPPRSGNDSAGGTAAPASSGEPSPAPSASAKEPDAKPAPDESKK